MLMDQVGVAYGAVLILNGLITYFRRSSALALLFGVVLGAWSVYNATHVSRQNNVANLAIAAIVGILLFLRVLFGRRSLVTLIIVALSAFQVFRNYPYLK